MNDTLSIGMVCFPAYGGSGVVASELAAGLAERGHRLHLIASAFPPRQQGKVEFHAIRTPDYPLFEHPPYTVALASAIAELSRAHRLDLVHVHYAVPHATSAWIAARILGAAAPRIVVSLHGTDVTTVGADPAYRPATAFAVEQADGVVVPSGYLLEEARSRLGLREDLPIEVIPNFVDTERFAPASTRDPSVLASLFEDGGAAGPTLIHVSNFRPVKRTPDLMEVLHHLRRRIPARMVLVGDGPDRQRTQQRARDLGLSEAVRFLGNRSDFGGLLRHADLFLLTSEIESFGLAALESLSSGVPVCGYRVGGVPEVVGEEAGVLVEKGDTEALAAVAFEVLQHPEKRDTLGRKARARVEARFARGPALDRYESLYRRLVAGEGRP